jgi:hypothetical protein
VALARPPPLAPRRPPHWLTCNRTTAEWRTRAPATPSPPGLRLRSRGVAAPRKPPCALHTRAQCFAVIFPWPTPEGPGTESFAKTPGGVIRNAPRRAGPPGGVDERAGGHRSRPSLCWCWPGQPQWRSSSGANVCAAVRPQRPWPRRQRAREPRATKRSRKTNGCDHAVQSKGRFSNKTGLFGATCDYSQAERRRQARRPARSTRGEQACATSAGETRDTSVPHPPAIVIISGSSSGWWPSSTPL